SHYPAIPPARRTSLVTTPPHECPYLPDRLAENRAFLAQRVLPESYHELVDAGFRRSGRGVYQPPCPGWRASGAVPVPVERFRPSKSQRRVWRRNSDLSISVGPARCGDEDYALFARYMSRWHGSDTARSRDDYESFLHDSPVDTLQFHYRDASGRL